MNSPGTIRFVKATACGNDFLIVEETGLSDLPSLSRRLCDRHNGVGADGVEWLSPDADADTNARLINADGSEAEISGNGTRCVAAYLCSQESKQKVVVRTGAGLKTCTVISQNHPEYKFEIAMGTPQTDAELCLPLATGDLKGIPVSMGNPHFVSFMSEFPTDWQSRATEIQRDPKFEHGVNVEFVTVNDQLNISVRFFERGVGETQSSGTGSCAAAVAAIVKRKGKSPIAVHTPGGIQTVRWDGEVFLTGSAILLLRGEFFT